MSTGNKAIPDLPAIPDPTGGSLYIIKDSTDYRVDTGGAGGLATLGADGLLDPTQRFTLSSIPWANVTSKPTTIAGYAITASDLLTTVKTVDGASSGLDADQLDGQEGSYYLSWSNLTGKPTTLGGYGITDAVNNFGAQTITGIKSFVNTISGNISGSAGSVPWSGITSKPTTVSGFGLTDAMTLNGTGGIGFGSVVSASNTDNTKHISLHASSNYGFNVTAGALNYTVNGSGSHHFNIGGTDRAVISSSGLAVTGAITATGNITGYASDARLKTNIKNIENPMDKIYKIGGYSFDWDEKKCFVAGFKPVHVHEHGVLAQEVMKVVPDAVSKAAFDPNYLTVNYSRLVPLLIECIKDLQSQIDELKGNI